MSGNVVLSRWCLRRPFALAIAIDFVEVLLAKLARNLLFFCSKIYRTNFQTGSLSLSFSLNKKATGNPSFTKPPSFSSSFVGSCMPIAMICYPV